ncbi:class I SAM-dependent methyltransferase, partial [Desulfovibrio sp. OttesenSCG-928-A18]|nr:class I SAM-dependent methyltransferase [Desulfovibrio sp. OttesenSCG-928-A18]
MNSPVHIFVASAEPRLFERCFSDNPFLAGLSPQPLSAPGAPTAPAIPGAPGRINAAALFNAVLDSWPEDKDAWLLFCPDYMEFLQNPWPPPVGAGASAGKLSRAALYGVMGCRMVKNLRGKRFCEHFGRMREPAADGGEYLSGLGLTAAMQVEALGCGLVLLHSSLAARLCLRFDEAFADALYVEDLCLRARAEHGTLSLALPVDFRLHRSTEELGRTAAHSPGLALFNSRHGSAALYPFAPDAPWGNVLQRKKAAPEAVYHCPVDRDNPNVPAVAALSFIRRGARLLDVGCAYGDIGAFFQKERDSVLWGMERDPAALAHASRRMLYRELVRADLDDFRLSDLHRFYGFFDHIYLGDVLEHLRDPQSALGKLSVFLAPEASCIASLPNVAHAYVIGALLEQRFPYDDSGLLDRTHLRFFTWQGQAELFAEAGLEAQRATAVFMGPNAFARWPLARTLPWSLYRYWDGSRHFFTAQYVSELRLSKLPKAELLRRNRKILEASVLANAAGWEREQAHFKAFAHSLLLARNLPLPEEKVKLAQALLEIGNEFGAVEHSGLFDPAWYLADNPDVLAGGVVPLAHYCVHGWKEGRRPSEYFDPQWYARQKPMVSKEPMNPVLHYLNFSLLDGTQRVRPDEDYLACKASDYVLER